MSKKLIVVAVLGITLVQVAPAAHIPCIICVGKPPNEICIPPGCTPLEPPVGLARDQDW